MTMTALLKEAQALKPRQRVTLVNKLLALDLGEDLDENEKAARVEDVTLGRVKLENAEEMMREARALAGIAGEPPRLAMAIPTGSKQLAGG